MTAPWTPYAPGPWAVEYSRDRQEGNDQRPMPFVVDRQGGRVARLWVGGTPHEANGRLIAAAPRMAEILLFGWQHVSHGGPTRGEVEDVLRQAGILPGREEEEVVR